MSANVTSPSEKEVSYGEDCMPILHFTLPRNVKPPVALNVVPMFWVLFSPNEIIPESVFQESNKIPLLSTPRL